MTDFAWLIVLILLVLAALAAVGAKICMNSADEEYLDELAALDGEEEHTCARAKERECSCGGTQKGKGCNCGGAGQCTCADSVEDGAK